jgi:hypothetical protein
VHELTDWLFAAWSHVCAVTLVLGNGRGSRLIDARAAQRLQDGAENVGDVLVWTVYGSPGKFVARPCMTMQGVVPMPVHLEGMTLELLRAQLPKGLTRSDRLADDAAIVVETWQ